jgi:Flp pilus assembly protein TadG
MKSRTRIDARGRLRGGLRGQTYAEFMMVVLPTISLIFGIFSFGMIIYTYNFISNSARDAVRYAIVHGSKSTAPATADTLQTLVRNEAKDINASSITVTSCWNPQAPPNQCPGPSGNNAPGKVVSVSVSYSYQPFYPFSNVTLPLTSSAQMIIDY